MSLQSVWQSCFGFFGKPVVVKTAAAELTSDAGLLPIRQFDEVIGLTEQFAAALTDLRFQPCVEHPLVEMVRMRLFGIAGASLLQQTLRLAVGRQAINLHPAGRQLADHPP